MKPLEAWRHDENARLGASTNKSTANPAMLAGIRYHNKVYKTLRLHCALNLPGWTLMVEPWFRTETYKLRSPDGVLINHELKQAVVIEVKKNWADGRDVKLLTEYLPIVKSAFTVLTFPLMIVGNVRGLDKKNKPYTSMDALLEPLGWRPGSPTPTLLML